MRRQRNAKIVATLGPASSTPAMIASLFHRGVDVFRLNFSHGTHADHRRRMEAIRAVEAKAGRPIGVLMDLQGPKLRVGTFAHGPVLLAAGASLRLDLDPAPGSAKRVCLPHPEIFAIMKPGLQLLLDDGKLRLEVERCNDGHAITRVKVGGKLSERKGVNIPDAIIPLSSLTAKDRRDLEFGLELGADWVALSFVQRPEDIDEARALIGDRAGIMAKLEKPMAITKLDAIVDRADSIMVARGDLGRRDAARAGADGAAAHPARVPPRRQAGDRRHPDAGIDDHLARAHARRGVRRRHGGLRWRRRRHAVGRIGVGPVSARGGGDHGPDHPRGGAGRALPDTHRRPARGAPGDSRGCHLAFAARGGAHRVRQGHRHLHAFRFFFHSRVARAARGPDPEPDAEDSRPRAGWRSSGACIRC